MIREAPKLTGDVLLSVAEVSARYRVTRQTIYLWIRKGALPVIRIGPGATIRVSQKQADALLVRAESGS
jgi:excisionase family DNA binding protein